MAENLSQKPSRISRKQSEILWALAATVACVAGAVWMFRGFWSADVFIAGVDTFSHDYLMWEWGWKMLLQYREVPLWNPYLFGGWPFVASFAFCPFYPPAWLSVWFPTSLAITSQYALHVALGGIGFYAFARGMRVSAATAFLIAIFYESGGHVFTLAHPGHLAKVQALAWLPWAMACAVMAARNGRLRWIAGLGICLALQLLASHAQIFYITAAMAFLYIIAASIFAAFHERTAEPPWNKGLRAGWMLGGAAIICVGLSAIQMLPAMELASESNRGGGVPYETASFGGLPPEEIFELALPVFRGASIGGMEYFGRWHSDNAGHGAQRLVSDYAGASVFLLGILGLFISRRRSRYFFAAVFLLAALVSMGAYTPVHRLCYLIVPGFSRFRSPASFMAAAYFAIFALAIFGLEAILAHLKSLKQRPLWLWIAPGLLLCAASIIFLIKTESTPSKIFLWSLRHSTIHLIILVVPLCLYFIFRNRLRHSAAFIVLIALIAAGTLFANSWWMHAFLPKNPTAGLLDYLYRNPVESVILRHHQRPEPPTMIVWGNELTNRPMMRGVRTIHGYHPVVYGRYEKLLEAMGYFYTPTTFRHFALNYLVLPKNEAPLDGWMVLADLGSKRVIARTDPIPFARIPAKVESLPKGQSWNRMTTETMHALIAADDYDPVRITYHDGPINFDFPQISTATLATRALKVQALYQKPNELRLRWQSGPTNDATRRNLADEKGMLPVLLAQPYDKNWKMHFEKGEDTFQSPYDDMPWQANGLFTLGLIDPHADTETVLRYRPLSYTIGKYTTLGSLLVLLMTVLIRKRLRVNSSKTDPEITSADQS
ncbi:MAG: hypothetical protein ACLFQ6_04315 [Candidatus Sumerlaeia bacterium]